MTPDQERELVERLAGLKQFLESCGITGPWVIELGDGKAPTVQ